MSRKVIRIDVWMEELCAHCLQSHDRHLMHFCASCDGPVCIYCLSLADSRPACPECLTEGDES